jgi:vitamin B12 transporter
MKNIGLCLVFIAVSAVCFGQVSDSILYPEVKVESQRISEAIGSSVSEIDSLLFTLLQSQGLTKILQTESFISTRSYSPGGIANYSVRGSGSQHTQVVWDGIPINDPMLGQTDLSTVALNSVSSVRVLYGSAGLTNNSGGIGGTIELQSLQPRKKDGIDAKLNLSAGSFGTYSVGIQLRDRFKSFFGTTTVEYHTAKNNFPFVNMATLVDKERVLEHAEVERIGFSKSIGAQINAKNTLTARVNYSQVDRELPPTMVMASTKEELFDRDIWASLKWSRLGNRSSLNVTASYIYGKQEYSDNNEYTYNHLYQASKNLIRYKLYLPYNLQLEVGGDVFAEHAKSDSAFRNDSHWRQWQAVFTSLKYVPKKWVAAQVLVREDVIDGKFSPVQGLVGVEVKPTNWFFVKGNVARNFRAPTLDDLYWRPGGNEDLKSESGFSWEAGLGFKTKGKKFKFRFEATYFQSEIDNWIIWLPEGSLWTPQNKRAVSSKGVESQLTTSVKVGKAMFRLNGAYTYVQSEVSEGSSQTDNSVGKQLIYVPKHQAKGQFSVHLGKLFLLYGHEFTGLRYTTSDNQSSLPAYQLGWVTVGYEHVMKKHSIGLNISVENLFNKAYQSIAWRPMPGRAFLINLNYKFS